MSYVTLSPPLSLSKASDGPDPASGPSGSLFYSPFDLDDLPELDLPDELDLPNIAKDLSYATGTQVGLQNSNFPQFYNLLQLYILNKKY